MIYNNIWLLVKSLILLLVKIDNGRKPQPKQRINKMKDTKKKLTKAQQSCLDEIKESKAKSEMIQALYSLENINGSKGKIKTLESLIERLEKFENKF